MKTKTNLTLQSAHSIINPERFESACQKVLTHPQTSKGIGTLKEKTVHAVLKHYYEPNEQFHEIKVGSYVADIMNNHQIIEIQTRHFNTMKQKLDAFLSHYQVTIVYPVAYIKWIRWIDEETGEISPKRKSPKTGTIYRIIPELYRIKDYLAHPNLHFIVCFLNVEESRLLNGWSKDKKKGSTRDDGIPVALVDEIHLSSLRDFHHLLPSDLPNPFTSKDYKQKAKITQKVASTGLHILHHLGVIQRIGKQGHAYLYKRIL